MSRWGMDRLGPRWPGAKAWRPARGCINLNDPRDGWVGFPVGSTCPDGHLGCQGAGVWLSSPNCSPNSVKTENLDPREKVPFAVSNAGHHAGHVACPGTTLDQTRLPQAPSVNDWSHSSGEMWGISPPRAAGTWGRRAEAENHPRLPSPYQFHHDPICPSGQSLSLSCFNPRSKRQLSLDTPPLPHLLPNPVQSRRYQDHIRYTVDTRLGALSDL